MALSTETAAALVAAETARQPAPRPADVSVRVLRPFMYRGQRLEADSQVNLPPAFAAEMAGAGKVARLANPTTTEPAAPAAKAARAARKEA